MADYFQRRLLRIGAVSLSSAVVVLAAGLTLFRARLQGMLFVWYWLGCFVLVGTAILAALLDLWTIRRQARAARRDLVRRVFGGGPTGRTPDLNAAHPSGRFSRCDRAGENSD